MVSRSGWRVLLCCGALWLASGAQAQDSSCAAVWPPTAGSGDAMSLDLPDTLLRLRDIGHSDPGLGGASPLAVSPDGRHVAFFVTRAAPEANDSCETLLVSETQGPRAVSRVLDSGGSAIRLEEVLRGRRRPSGVFDVNIPVWSPDGRSLLYRKRLAGRTQVWRAHLDGRPPEQLTHAEQDVEAAAWSGDGARVLYAVRPARAVVAAARAAEARQGYLYDARFLPHLAAAPQLPADLPEAVMAIPADGGAARPASAEDSAAFMRPVPLGLFPNGPVAGPGGSMAGAAAIDQGYFAQQRLWVQRAGSERRPCRAPRCTGWIRGVWWHGAELMALKREGWHRETSTILAWTPASGGVRPVLRTQDWLTGCVTARREILCLAEHARQPRRILAIDPATGRQRVFFDPNPDIAVSGLPRVERLRWRNGHGLPAWGDLVIPNGKPPVGGWPLVIVQYHSEGFLRGGTGDEYPIFPLAARGIAVLSFQRPPLVASLDPSVTDVSSLIAATYRDWADRRSVHDSLMTGLDLVLARGDIDPRRIGISGFSDGSTTARYALINDNRFAAAAISSCCLEPFSTMALGGIAQADWFRSAGFPDASRGDPSFWKPMSMAMNAATMTTPLLMQLADDEYLQALETFTALREHGKPVEMYVFPGEHHIKWQPLHRAAVYQRNLDWFAFWLQGRVDRDPDKVEQYRRWRAMAAPTTARVSAMTAPSARHRPG